MIGNYTFDRALIHSKILRPKNSSRITDFQAKVYLCLLHVPKGKVTTYKDLAHAIHSKAYRAVGSALNKNPFAPKVPCHRVVNSDGSLGGFAKGKRKKALLLKREGIKIIDGKIRGFERVRFVC